MGNILVFEVLLEFTKDELFFCSSDYKEENGKEKKPCMLFTGVPGLDYVKDTTNKNGKLMFALIFNLV